MTTKERRRATAAAAAAAGGGSSSLQFTVMGAAPLHSLLQSPKLILRSSNKLEEPLLPFFSCRDALLSLYSSPPPPRSLPQRPLKGPTHLFRKEETVGVAPILRRESLEIPLAAIIKRWEGGEEESIFLGGGKGSEMWQFSYFLFRLLCDRFYSFLPLFFLCDIDKSVGLSAPTSCSSLLPSNPPDLMS